MKSCALAIRAAASTACCHVCPLGAGRVVSTPKSDVIIETVVEKDSLLIDVSHQRTQVVGTDIAYIGAIDGDSAGYGVVEARKEVSQGVLPLPDCPTKATICPLRIERLIWRRTGTSSL